ncbi:hypothetical protein [Actinopolymorpha pittospori]|uniref:Uncharacterized protein n=1 Tax=Actinopolymorpha pittospori TaxID=648752 RepID=A0A927R762_9ACTN|nr:hypothetical protein [Actinopolymorpha pittospori]MBE1603889.1 hypothetical protein [Actinopolymorpha pittospori]
MSRTDDSARGSFWRLAARLRGHLILSGVLMALGALSGLLLVAAAMALFKTLVPALGGDPGAAKQAWLLVGAEPMSWTIDAH